MPVELTPNNVTMLEAMQGGVPVEYGQPIIEEMMLNSVVMQTAKYEQMTAPEKIFDVYAGGLGAYWVGEGERIQTTKAKWIQVKMTAKKLAVIFPVTREFLTYKQSDFFRIMKPLIAGALYKKFDAAAIGGVDNPFAQSVDASATGARAIEGDITVENLDALNGALNDQGFEPNAYISKVQNNTALKNLIRDRNGLKQAIYDHQAKELDSVPVFNFDNEIEEIKKGTLYAGDFNYAYYGIPYNMHYKISEDATLTTIQDAEGNPYNLFERDSVAMRVVMDVAFMIVKDEAFASIKAPTV